MSRPADKVPNYPQSPSIVDAYKAPNEQAIKSPNARTSRPLSTTQNDQHDHDNQTLRKLMTHQSLSPSSSRSSSNTNLRSMIIDGQWKYRGHDDDHLRLQSMGIENLVTICHDIMRYTLESPNQKPERRLKSSSTKSPWPIIKLDEFKNLTSTDRASLRRAHVFDLMTIVSEAVSTDASISQLVRIWREASEHNLHSRRSKSSESQPLISYDHAIEQLIRTPDNHLLQIAVHASLISTQNQSDLQRLGEKLGIERDQFDIRTIRKSTEAFRFMIQFLRKQKLRQKREQQFIDVKRLPYNRKQKQGLCANVSGTKFRMICRAVDVCGFLISPNPDFTCNLLWSDTLISMDIVSALKPYQKINHFPTMNEISRKDLLAKNYDRLRSFAPKEYNFAPKTWTLPKEYNLWYSYASNKPKQMSTTYIVKPTNTAMGQGIAIHCDYKQIKSMENYIVQEYIQEPYLLDGFKFDLRIYALITSCDPLRIFIFNNGLVRMSSKKYQLPTPNNALDLSMHLTNYLLEENSPDDLDTINGKKSALKDLFKHLKKEGRDVDKLWKEIQNIIVRTLFLAEPHMLSAYQTCRPGTLPTSESVCFELLGFDILIDKNLKPWIIEVNRSPGFDTSEQIEFDIKIKLLCDTFDLLRFRLSDRKKSIAIEKAEAQRRLYSSIDKRTDNPTLELDKMKDHLFLLRREKAREVFESHHAGGYIRVFPVDDKNHMIEFMNILTKCFDVLSPVKMDLSWSMKYYQQHHEEDLLNKINQLENSQTIKQQVSINSVGLDRASSTTSFAFDSGDDENEYSSKSPRSDQIKKPLPSRTDSFMKRVSTQTPSDILRSTSLTSLTNPKQRSNSLASSGTISRPEAESRQAPPGVSASRITEKKAYTTPPPSEHRDQQRSHSPKHRRSNDKSQTVTYSSIVQATRKQQLTNQSTTDITKELQLTETDFNRLHQLIFNEMNKLCIHYPNQSDQETYRICTEIMENWPRYKADIGRFWLVELDANKRQSVVQIVWNNIQQIMKKLCIVHELVEQLPLNRHLIKLERRLLANHGQCMWETCQNRHNSWESFFIKGTKRVSDIEFDCCYRFVELCREALFVVYQFSIDDKFQKQKSIDPNSMLMIKY